MTRRHGKKVEPCLQRNHDFTHAVRDFLPLLDHHSSLFLDLLRWERLSLFCQGAGGIVRDMELLLAALVILLSLTLAATQKKPERQPQRAYVRVTRSPRPPHRH